ncbi:ABC transporter ATP-binding protein [Paenibacillus ferrarius]|uniref:ABC transporter ATP-binding protein n=1 Tax=Paenibacillus ferrarius TaxID=1469647 RepID=UPI003D29FF3E
MSLQADDKIQVANLRLKYPGTEGELIFKGLSCSIEPGEKVLLLGPSGCGKSTLLQVMSGIVPDIVELPLKADAIRRPERWGYVFQDPDTQFCMPYVDEEIAFVLENRQIPREAMPARIAQYLALVGLRLPNTHTLISELSQGMKQRLALASVLALEPEVLFLDEPTALLDEEGTDQVWETIRSVAPGKTLVIVEHKIDGILDLIDRLIVLSAEGEILADGAPQMVFQTMRPFLREAGIWYPGVWEDWDAAREEERAWSERGAGEGRDQQAQSRGLGIGQGREPEPEQRQEQEQGQGQGQGQEQGREQEQEQEQSQGQRREHDPHPLTADSSSTLLAFQQFEAFRGRNVTVAVDNLTVTRGDWIAVVGANGAGKSSLLLAIMGLLPTRGECHVAGAAGRKVEQLAASIGFVFQNPEFQFVTNSVEEELTYLQPKVQQESMRAAREALLRQYGLLELRERHPFALSLGQKRRLSVATAMVRSPRVLLLDEPTFGLDAHGTLRMLEGLERLRAAGTGIVMVTHDPELVRRFATRVWHVADGRVREAARPADAAALVHTSASGKEVPACN